LTTSALGKRPLREPEQRPSLKTSWSSKFSRVIDYNPAHFDSQLTSAADTNNPTSLAPKLRPYPPNLCPLPSTNRPHCLAKDRLHLWTPTTPSTRSASTSTPSATSDDALNHILEVIRASWADSTKVLYSNALLVYHIYCDLNRPIPDHEQCPISGTLLLAFLSSCAGGASGSTLSNYAAGIKAWHLLHSQSWNIHQDELRLTLQGAARLAPRNSKHAKHPPVTIDDLKIIRANLNMNDPGDAAVYTCTVVTFYCVARLGKFMVPNVWEKIRTDEIYLALRRFHAKGQRWSTRHQIQNPCHEMRPLRRGCAMRTPTRLCHRPRSSAIQPSSSQSSPSRRSPLHMETSQERSLPAIQNASHEQISHHRQMKQPRGLKRTQSTARRHHFLSPKRGTLRHSKSNRVLGRGSVHAIPEGPHTHPRIIPSSSSTTLQQLYVHCRAAGMIASKQPSLLVTGSQASLGASLRLLISGSQLTFSPFRLGPSLGSETLWVSPNHTISPNQSKDSFTGSLHHRL
jgi:hypothetical protein